MGGEGYTRTSELRAGSTQNTQNKKIVSLPRVVAAVRTAAAAASARTDLLHARRTRSPDETEPSRRGATAKERVLYSFS